MPYLKEALNKKGAKPLMVQYFLKFTSGYLGEKGTAPEKKLDELMVAFTFKMLYEKPAILTQDGLNLYKDKKETYDRLLVDATEKALNPAAPSPLLAYVETDPFIQAVIAEFRAYFEEQRLDQSISNALATSAVVSEEKSDSFSQLPVDTQLSRIAAEITKLGGTISVIQESSKLNQTKTGKDLRAAGLTAAQQRLNFLTQQYKLLSSQQPVTNESQTGSVAFWKPPVIPVTSVKASYGKAVCDEHHPAQERPKPY